MIVKMSHYAHLASQSAKRFGKAWDYWVVHKDAYLQGYRQARQDAIEAMTVDCPIAGRVAPPELFNLGNQEVEVDVSPPEHHLSPNAFKKWENDFYNLSFSEALKTYLINFNINSIYVNITKEGAISFQGIASKKTLP